jgi:hypothetical protein
MSERGNPANRNEAPDRRIVDDKDGPLWSEDEEIASGRNWAVILVFIFVPLMAVVVLGLTLYALFAHVFGTPQAPETVIESSERPS